MGFPMASETALTTAGATTPIVGSPIPPHGPLIKGLM